MVKIVFANFAIFDGVCRLGTTDAREGGSYFSFDFFGKTLAFSISTT
jgi:hypothetical protein